MASRWLIHKRGDESLAFGELVGLARSGNLSEEDLVKADWEPEWRPAHTVVGLFYRVRRAAFETVGESRSSGEASTPLQSSSESAFSFDDLAVDLALETADDSISAPTADPRWMQRYREVTEQRVAETADSPIAPEIGASSMRLLAEAAVAAQERRWAFRDRLGRWQDRWNRVRVFAGSPLVFRLACAVFVAVLVSVSLASWSRQAALRFPKPGMPDRYVVPGVGDCTPKEFSVVLGELALASAVLGYLGAKRVEAWAGAK
jgi:hypothetical protein